MWLNYISQFRNLVQNQSTDNQCVCCVCWVLELKNLGKEMCLESLSLSVSEIDLWRVMETYSHS